MWVCDKVIILEKAIDLALEITWGCSATNKFFFLTYAVGPHIPNLWRLNSHSHIVILYSLIAPVAPPSSLLRVEWQPMTKEERGSRWAPPGRKVVCLALTVQEVGVPAMCCWVRTGEFVLWLVNDAFFCYNLGSIQWCCAYIHL